MLSLKFFKKIILLRCLEMWCSGFTLAGNTKDGVFEHNDHTKYLVNSPGCRIPQIEISMTHKKPNIPINYCGERLIHIKKSSNQSYKFQFKHGSLQSCHYRFMFASSHSLRPDTDVIFDSWVPFDNQTEIKLKSDFIEVQCVSQRGDIMYEDVYSKIKKVNRTKSPNDKIHWNVLIIGMDTVSRARALYELPRTVAYFRSARWMDFRAYNKIAENTLPNVLSILTNKNISTLNHRCQLDMYPCNNDFIWSKFKTAGYVTAYGDDQSMASFQKQPTDHYLKTLFHTKEQQAGNKNCLKRMLSAGHVFSYARDFLDTYKRENFFGYFWVTSLSHESNRDQSPSMFDAQLSTFFRELAALDILDSTFIIFHSDHGFRFSNYRKVLESYYESRLPMFFMRVPGTFRQKYPNKYINLHVQQRRLVVPFDFHLTLLDIAQNFTNADLYHEGCALCTSLFKKSKPSRTCADAGVDDSWCACRELNSVSVHEDISAYHSLAMIMLKLYNITNNIRTEPFTRCHELSLSKLLRVHTFKKLSKVFYVIAGTLHPDETGFEATVSKVNGKYEIVSMEITTSYERPIQCVKNKDERVWCVCESLVFIEKSMMEKMP